HHGQSPETGSGCRRTAETSGWSVRLVRPSAPRDNYLRKVSIGASSPIRHVVSHRLQSADNGLSGSRALPSRRPTCVAWCKPSMPAGFEHDPGRREGGDNPCGRAERLTLPEASRTNADDRLPRAPLGRVEGGDSFVEGRDVADVRPQPSVTHTPDDLTQLGAIGHDNEVDRQAVG